MADKSIVYLITSNGMGTSSEQPLREKLITTFLHLLNIAEVAPVAICLYTDGVRLACEGSPVLEELTALEQKGTHIILCQTCLNYFQLVDKVKVGIIGGMGDIVTAMQSADSVITI